MHKIEDSMILEMLTTQGMTDAQAASQLNVSRMTVSRIRKRL